jgi:hypothetical protein
MNSRIANVDNITALQESISRLSAEATGTLVSSHKRKKIESQIKVAIDELTALLATLDPIAQPTAVFDPSNPEVVGRFVALAMVAQERHPLSGIPTNLWNRDSDLRRSSVARAQQCPDAKRAGRKALWSPH